MGHAGRHSHNLNARWLRPAAACPTDDCERPALRKRRCCSDCARAARRLYLLPLALALADVLESTTLAVLARTYGAGSSPLTWPATAFTLVKRMLSLTTLSVTCGGAALWP